MIRFHKEGYFIIGTTIIALGVLNLAWIWFSLPLFWLIQFISVVVAILVLQFFRNPVRKIEVIDNHLFYAPADGKVVVIEETFEPEYFQDKRLQVSIFMSPLNVHVQRNPISGIVQYYKYHAGKYLVAWHPKSSTENERTTTVFKVDDKEILVRQVAGAVAKRIINYLHEGQHVTQGTDFGFIKFGSRVDIYFPLGTEIVVNIDDKVKGNKTIIAKL